jgi:hypothetical protein
VAEYPFDFISLFDLYAHPYRVDRGLYENALILVTRDRQWVEEDFFGYSDIAKLVVRSSYLSELNYAASTSGLL